MAVTEADVKFLFSGGTNNSDPAQSHGGAPGAEIPVPTAARIFDNVSNSELRAGAVDYRCIYVKNESPTTWQAVRAWLAANTPAASTEVRMALDAAAVGSDAALLADETVRPAGNRYLGDMAEVYAPSGDNSIRGLARVGSYFVAIQSNGNYWRWQYDGQEEEFTSPTQVTTGSPFTLAFARAICYAATPGRAIVFHKPQGEPAAGLDILWDDSAGAFSGNAREMSGFGHTSGDGNLLGAAFDNANSKLIVCIGGDIDVYDYDASTGTVSNRVHNGNIASTTNRIESIAVHGGALWMFNAARQAFRCTYTPATGSVANRTQVSETRLPGDTWGATEHDGHLFVAGRESGSTRIRSFLVSESQNLLDFAFPTESDPLTIGNMTENQYKAIWLRRKVKATETGGEHENDSVTVSARGETAG